MINIVFDINNSSKKKIRPKPPLSHRKNISANLVSRIKAITSGITPKDEKNEKDLVFPPLKNSYNLMNHELKLLTTSSIPFRESINKNELSTRVSTVALSKLNGTQELNLTITKALEPSNLKNSNEENNLHDLKQSSRRPKSQNSKENSNQAEPTLEVRKQRRLFSGTHSKVKMVEKQFLISARNMGPPDPYPSAYLGTSLALSKYRTLKLLLKKSEFSMKGYSEERMNLRNSLFCILCIEDIVEGTVIFFPGDKKKEEKNYRRENPKDFPELLSELIKSFTVILLCRSDLFKDEFAAQKYLNDLKYDFDAVYSIEKSHKSLYLNITSILDDFKVNNIRSIAMIRTLPIKQNEEFIETEKFEDVYGMFPICPKLDPKRVSLYLLPRTYRLRAFAFKCYDIITGICNDKIMVPDNNQGKILKQLLLGLTKKVKREREIDSFFDRITKTYTNPPPSNESKLSDNSYEMGALSDLRSRISNYFKFNQSELKRNSKLLQYNVCTSIGDILLRNVKIWERVFCLGYQNSDERVRLAVSNINSIRQEYFLPKCEDANESTENEELQYILQKSPNIFVLL